jgi:Short C-terminal domain
VEASSRAARRATARLPVLAAFACLALATSLVPSGLASATPQEERQGSQILKELEAGALKCSEATASDFELVGEYAMGRMFGSPAQHEAMNQMMSRMMGTRGEESVHEAMGRRFSGCGGGQLPPGFGQMMGAVNAMGMMGGGMMGGGPGQGGGSYGSPGSMMGGYGYPVASNENDEDFDGPSAGAMVGMMAVLIGAVALAIFLLARWQPGGPQETLKRRYAKGELSAEEYQEHRRLLEGS